MYSRWTSHNITHVGLCVVFLSMMMVITRASHVRACTAAYHAPSHFMLKSYDWHDGAGDLYLNPRGVSRVAFGHEASLADVKTQSTPHRWSARYASLSFNQYGRGYPNGGINESGLALEVLWLNEAQASKIDQRPYLNELEWVQYVLDTQSTVSDVLEVAEQVRISPIHGQVHYMTCDVTGVCATLELLKGELVVHTGQDLPHPVLTNHTYQSSLSHYQSLDAPLRSSERGSLARFATAAHTLKNPEPQRLIQALRALDRVKIAGYTQWQIAYDLKRHRVAFRTALSSTPRQVGLEALIKSAPQNAQGCAATLTYPLSRRDQGLINQHFKPPQLKIERRQLRIRLKRLGLSAKLADALSEHGARCTDTRPSHPE